mmetsp:Transcript_14239/g.33811  ORF Transcript_14239/g.33811 Transcript_14239/m.33811 type:complete len:119 (-) Transcript_14239:916-1272(-)
MSLAITSATTIAGACCLTEVIFPVEVRLGLATTRDSDMSTRVLRGEPSELRRSEVLPMAAGAVMPAFACCGVTHALACRRLLVMPLAIITGACCLAEEADEPLASPLDGLSIACQATF